MDIYSYNKLILREINDVLNLVDETTIELLIDKILRANKIFFVGVGRVKLSIEAIAKRWYHLGIDTVIVGEITEPAISSDDVLIVVSGSGESIVPYSIAKRANSLGSFVVHIGSNPDSKMNAVSDMFVRIPTNTKLKKCDEYISKQPMTSLFEQSVLILGDAIAMKIIDDYSLNTKEIQERHANLE